MQTRLGRRAVQVRGVSAIGAGIGKFACMRPLGAAKLDGDQGAPALVTFGESDPDLLGDRCAVESDDDHSRSDATMGRGGCTRIVRASPLPKWSLMLNCGRLSRPLPSTARPPLRVSEASATRCRAVRGPHPPVSNPPARRSCRGADFQRHQDTENRCRDPGSRPSTGRPPVPSG